ncbi:MAG: type VI secretion system Vgr family protein [Thiohalomonadales bacterium]
MEGKPLPYNTASIGLKVKGEFFDVIKMKGVEALSTPFQFKIDALVDRFFDMSGSLQSPAQLSLTGIDGVKRTISGIITHVEEGQPHKDGQLKCRFILESSLVLLSLSSNYKVVLGHTLPDIVRAICETHGISNIKFDLSQNYPMRPYVVQTGETDLDFMQRILGKSGITFWSSCDIDNQHQERITFTDHNANCPYLARDVLQYKAPSNLVEQYNSRQVHVGLHHMQVKSFQQTGGIAIHDWNENTPSTNLYATTGVSAYGESQGFATTLRTQFGNGSVALDETERLAKQHAEYARCQSWYLKARGNVIDMAAGHVFSLDASAFNPEHSGDMIVTMVKHKASQGAGLNLDGHEVAYRHKAYCIKRETPYRPYIPAHPKVPMVFNARIESEGKYASLDQQGRYKLRNLFDLSRTEHTQATIPIRKLQPFGGPPSDSTVGMHMPLQDGDEVLLSCLNGDPDRPMIVGSGYTADKTNPVTARNKTQNIIRTQSGNELLMDDKIEHEVISLHTYEGYNILRFNADISDHKLLLESKLGAMTQFAKKTHRTETGNDTIVVRSGNNRLEIVENNHSTETEQGVIHHQAKTDVIETAYKSIKIESGDNTEIRAGNDMVVNVEDNATFTINGSDGFFATVKNGALTINAAKEISIKGKGGGDITFEQSGGGFKIDPMGNIKMYGKTVQLGGQGAVNLIGNVSYTIGGGMIPPATMITPPLTINKIDALIDPEGPQIFNAAWNKSILPHGNEIDLLFSVKCFSGGETITVDVYQGDPQAESELIDTLTTELDDGTGMHTVSWKSKVAEKPAKTDQNPETDQNSETEQGPTPFWFEASANETEVIAQSDILFLTQDIVLNIDTSKGGNQEGIQFLLQDATGKHHSAIVKEHTARFNQILLGPTTIVKKAPVKKRKKSKGLFS